jgi:hypothetical protein
MDLVSLLAQVSTYEVEDALFVVNYEDFGSWHTLSLSVLGCSSWGNSATREFSLLMLPNKRAIVNLMAVNVTIWRGWGSHLHFGLREARLRL